MFLPEFFSVRNRFEKSTGKFDLKKNRSNIIFPLTFMKKILSNLNTRCLFLPKFDFFFRSKDKREPEIVFVPQMFVPENGQ